MNTNSAEKLVKTDGYQVFLLVCPGNVPFPFIVHPWLVVNDHGTLSRWEVIFRKGICETSWGHLHQDFLPPFSGIEIIPTYRQLLWKGKLLGSVEGDVAERVAEFIRRSPEAYPFRERYSLLGPNSNTFVQWVLNAFPEFGVSLPWNAFGKGYRH